MKVWVELDVGDGVGGREKGEGKRGKMGGVASHPGSHIAPAHRSVLEGGGTTCLSHVCMET